MAYYGRRKRKRHRFIKKLLLLCVIAAVLFTAYKGREYFLHYNAADEAPRDTEHWDGRPAIPADGGIPGFAKEDISTECFVRLSGLDSLGRCGPALACIGPESLAEGERGEIGSVKPSGWQLEKYSFIDNGGFLYNRCHLLAWKLTGLNEEERNLITGTRYLNTEGMLPYENEVMNFVYRTGKHVMYRVTPVFREDELVARRVKIEAMSAEDGGRGLSFNVYCFNVQPGVDIDYRTGLSRMSVPKEE